MSRPAKPPRLELRTHRTGAKTWSIRDGTKLRSTGCGEACYSEALEHLREYVAEKRVGIARSERRLHEVELADVIALYATDKAPYIATAHKAAGRLARLLDWWGDKKLSDVSGRTCRAFAASRGQGATRRELQDLQAAIKYHRKEGGHRGKVEVTLPPAGEARQRWLTRDEVAHLIRICRNTREIQNDRDTNKRPLRHLSRFILFAVYTGSRPGDVLGASFRLSSSSGYVDLGSSLYYRKPAGKRATKKLQPTTPLPGRLCAHLRRWESNGHSVVEYGGLPARSIKTAWAHLTRLAGPAYADVVPYTLRHTAATWMVQRGVPLWEVAGYLGTSAVMIDRHYGHHAPEHLRRAANAIGVK